MANKQIYELSNVGNDLDNSALLAMDIPNPDSSAASEIPYVTRKASVNVLENQFLGEDEYTTELNTENQTIFGSINEVLTYAKNIADEYDDSATYAVGDFVTYMGVLYKCIVAISVAESWDSTHWDSTLIVDEFGGSGGASVTLGTTTPSDASGSNGDLYVQYDGTSYAAVYAYVKINNSWRKFPYAKVIALTQAEYDLITPDPTTLYIITDAQSSYQTKTDANLDTTATTVVGAINELNTGKADASTTYTKTEVEDLLDDKAKSINVVWANSCESSFTTRSQFLVIEASSGFYTVWFASTNQINVKEWTTNTVASGVDTVTLSNLKFERINKTGVTDEYKLRISANSSTAFTIIN